MTAFRSIAIHQLGLGAVCTSASKSRPNFKKKKNRFKYIPGFKRHDTAVKTRKVFEKKRLTFRA